MPKAVRISLANKCQLLFGAAVVLILIAALSVVWHRLGKLVQEGQQDKARTLVKAWLDGKIELAGSLTTVDEVTDNEPLSPGQEQSLTLLTREDFLFAGERDQFLKNAIGHFETTDDSYEFFHVAQDTTDRPLYRYARAIRKSDLLRLQAGAAAGFEATIDPPEFANPLQMLLLVQLRSPHAERQLVLNRVYIVAAGLFAGLLAIGVFWFVTMRIILSPVRVLRDTAAKISEGNLNIRAEINTGDEFEQLSEVFNTMIVNLKTTADQLRTTNKSLDLKLGELAEHNVALYEANKIKGEFLANVSHELRTPLNSIIGFAEVLQETLAERTGPVDEKRKRYVANIITSSRNLLELINDLLDLAKIEAGRMEVRVGPMNAADTSEALLNLMRPQAEKKSIQIQLKVEPNLPMLQTDARKVQQILFNFLSNAIKFTPSGGTVTMSAGLESPRANQPVRVRFSVSDTGPGIAIDQHEMIFEKFKQLDSAVTREHSGTGLGLTISRELSQLLQGRIQLESDVGRGATFSLILPLELQSRSAPLMPDLVDARAGDASI